MRKITIGIQVLLMIFISSRGVSQDKSDMIPQLIGSCEGCEAIFEYEDKILTAVDTLPDFNEEGPKLKVTGTVYMPDGKTPAGDVILYVYHTDQNGVYATRGDEKGWARRHGYIRGWIKTGSDGKYTFYTLRPGTYPSRSEPAHIHPIILEPDGKYYWLGSYYFADDPLLTGRQRNENSPRGGRGAILNLHKEGDVWVGTRDFVLGKNVPGYR
jgi:protocatechuate 3,4-dioxygenase, beta subunit